MTTAINKLTVLFSIPFRLQGQFLVGSTAGSCPDKVSTRIVRRIVEAEFGRMSNIAFGYLIRLAFPFATIKKRGKEYFYHGIRTKCETTLQPLPAYDGCNERNTFLEYDGQEKRTIAKHDYKQVIQRQIPRPGRSHYEVLKIRMKRREILLRKESQNDRLDQYKTMVIPNGLILPREDLIRVNTATLGEGTFGSCELYKYKGILVSVKQYKAQSTARKHMYHEAHVLLSIPVHRCITTLVGICTAGKQPPLLVTQYYGIQRKSITLHKALNYYNVTLREEDMYKIFHGITEALQHMHKNDFLHNDIKSNNILLQYRNREYSPVVIDFWKACLLSAGKYYSLDKTEKQKYRVKYPFLCPALIEGLERQSPRTDVFSFGYMLIKSLENANISVQNLYTIGKMCMSFNSIMRPTITVVNKKIAQFLL